MNNIKDDGNQMKAIQVKQYGDPSVLRLDDLPIPEPKADEALGYYH